MAMRLYHVAHGREVAESILKSGFQDAPLYRHEEASGRNPCGVQLIDDPIISYEHMGSEVLRIELDATEEALSPFEDLEAEGYTTEIDRFLERAWFRTISIHRDYVPALGCPC